MPTRLSVKNAHDSADSIDPEAEWPFYTDLRDVKVCLLEELVGNIGIHFLISFLEKKIYLFPKKMINISFKGKKTEKRTSLEQKQ